MYSPMTVSDVGRTTDGLFELLAAGMRDDGELGAESLDMLGLALQIALRDQQREVGVGRAGRLDPPVHVRLQQFPDRVPIRSDDHGPPHRPVVGELGFGNHILEPSGKVRRL